MLNRENTYFKELEEAGEEYEAKEDALDKKKKELVYTEEGPALYEAVCCSWTGHILEWNNKIFAALRTQGNKSSNYARPL